MLLCLIGLTSSMAQQEIKISGTVTDNQGVPLPGVNVLIEGTTKGTQTDFDGNYAITANTGEVLVFLYMGMKEFKKTVEKSEVINIQLEEDAQSLDEVVITALGISREK